MSQERKTIVKRAFRGVCPRWGSVTTEGLKRNAYANDVQSEVTLDDLFRE